MLINSIIFYYHILKVSKIIGNNLLINGILQPPCPSVPPGMLLITVANASQLTARRNNLCALCPWSPFPSIHELFLHPFPAAPECFPFSKLADCIYCFSYNII